MYVMLLDRLQDDVRAERQVAAVLMAAGAKDVRLPDPQRTRADFDAALTAEPARVDRDGWELRQALGVA